MSAESTNQNNVGTKDSGPPVESKDVKNETRVQNQKVPESDEDVPGDFFDDFLKEDFMAGLDIVDDDAWDDEKAKNDEGNTNEKSENKNDTKISDAEAIDSKKKREKSNPRSSSLKDKGKLREKRSKPRKRRNGDKEDEVQAKRSSDKQIDADDFDIRRDPQKTKRDIERDKVRCEKDKEMKIISEKLSLVETGLVPPGMEMEIDLEEVKRQKEKIIKSKSPRDLRERIRSLKEKNKSPDRRPRSPRKRSPIMAKRPLPPRRRTRSPRKDATYLPRISPKRSPGKRMLSRSPVRRILSRSPVRRVLSRSPRRMSPRPRSAERSSGRRKSRSHSPYYRKRRVRRSPLRRRQRSSSRESDREKWLKHRNRSRSPRRKEEKKSFLQEIAEKLNETRREPMNMMPALQSLQPMLPPVQSTLHYIDAQPIPVPPPVPVPPPNNAPPFPIPLQPQQYDPYDQSFFIGTGHVGQSQPSPINVNPKMPLNPLMVQSVESPFMPGDGIPNAPIVSNTPVNTDHPPKKASRPRPENQEEIAKLFHDKQITLSEFLAITAKPEVFSSSPSRIQDKIKVITRCHDAIKIIKSSENNYSGRLVVQKTLKFKSPSEKHLSPLKRELSQFPYVDPTVTNSERNMTLSTFINKLLQSLGLLKDAVINVDEENTNQCLDASGMNMQAPFDIPPPLPPLLMPIQGSRDAIKPKYTNKLNSNQLCKMIQTDVFKCADCEARKKILYRTTAVQSDEPPICFSVGTQVREEVFQPKLSKPQSLAALTPAQLLAKSRESLQNVSRNNRLSDVDDFEMYAASYNNRPGFYRGSEEYSMPRTNMTPFGNPDFDGFGMGGGGGGGGSRSRPLDPQTLRFHTSYY